jgi:predicted metal-dependent phosphoesterase TrpH
LVHHGAAKSADEAFRRFIGVGKPAFVPKPTLDADEVIGVVHGAGGVAILAHPASSRVGEEQIRELAALGLDGFEIQHPKHNPSARRKLAALIDTLGLLPSGGSDFHGPGSGRTKLGAHAVPLRTMEALREASLTYHHPQGSTKETQ